MELQQVAVESKPLAELHQTTNKKKEIVPKGTQKKKCNGFPSISTNAKLSNAMKYRLKRYRLQSMLTLIRFDTLGGMPLVAMHKYAAISKRETRAISNTSPSHSATIKSNCDETFPMEMVKM